jgi:hypothetical protein
MLAVLLAVGLAVDVSHLYVAGAELQNAADAAALAGASALNSNANGITVAVDRAVAAMNKYEFDKVSITIERDDVMFAVNLSEFDPDGSGGLTEAQAFADPDEIRFVKVKIPEKSVNVFFAGIALGSNIANMTREAVAGQSVAINYFCNVAPLSVVQDDITHAPLNVSPGCANNTEFTPGCTYTIRLAPSNSVSAGNYLILAIGSDRGGSDVRERLALGTDNCYTFGDTVLTEPGVTAGPVRQGLNTRFDIYQGGNLDPSQYPPDINIMENILYEQYGDPDYQQAPTHPGVLDRRVILIPIINLSEYDQGRNEVRIFRIGAFFLKRSVDNGNGGDIVAEYIDERIVIGDGGHDPDGDAGDPNLTVPVLYR